MSSSSDTWTAKISLPLLAKMIDHSLFHPTMTDNGISEGLAISAKYNVAAACIKPYSIPQARKALENTTVGICAVVGFPHGNSSVETKVFEATEAIREGAHEIDMVVNIGKVLSREYPYVEDEVRRINDAVISRNALLKVIFETDFLGEAEIIKLCEICTRVGVAFAKTSTGYGFVKQDNGMYSYDGATIPNLVLMRNQCGEQVQIKAAGGVRTLDDLIRVRALGVTRVGATATVAILEEAKRRGIGEELIEVHFSATAAGASRGSAY